MLSGIGCRSDLFVVTNVKNRCDSRLCHYDTPPSTTQSVITDQPGLKNKIKAGFGMDVRVMTRSHEELRKVIEENPFREHEDQPSKLAVAFLDKSVGDVTVDRELYLPDEFIVQGKEIYLWFPNGQADTKLMNNSFQKSIGVAATVRNWNTVTKMVALTQ